VFGLSTENAKCKAKVVFIINNHLFFSLQKTIMIIILTVIITGGACQYIPDVPAHSFPPKTMQRSRFMHLNAISTC